MIRRMILTALACLPVGAAAQTLDLFSMGAGAISGGYFQTARAICEEVNRSGPETVRCSPEPTAGSIYNLAMLRDGELEFALAQSDWQKAAHDGTGVFSGDAAVPGLRSVLALYPEVVTIVVGRESGIAGPGDLAGRRVDIGLPASGRNATVRALLGQLDFGTDFFGETVEHGPSQAAAEICAGTLDAAIFVVGHPDRRIRQLIDECGARLVPFASPVIDARIPDLPEYVGTAIPAGLYPGQARPVPSIAVYATLVTLADTPDALVESVTRAVLQNSGQLQQRALVLAGFDPRGAGSLGLSAPLHPGARAVLDAEAR